MPRSILKKIIKKINSLFGIEIKRVSSRKKSSTSFEIKRISALPRNEIFETTLLGNPIKGNSPGSFLFIYDELFKEGVYDFAPQSQSPFIIDCGVNIGLSIIYFKQRFP